MWEEDGYSSDNTKVAKMRNGGDPRRDSHNKDANNWRSSNVVSSSSNSLFSRSESCSCETSLHNSRTSELMTGSMVFAPTLVLQNFFQTFYQSKHG
jgi:hypothetical protein